MDGLCVVAHAPPCPKVSVSRTIAAIALDTRRPPAYAPAERQVAALVPGK